MAAHYLDVMEFKKYRGLEEYRSMVEGYLKIIHGWTVGKALLAELAARGSFYKVTIEYLENRCDYKKKPALNQALLYFDENRLLKAPYNIDPTQDFVVKRKEGVAVYLFHELVHYYHDLEGLYKKKGDHDQVDYEEEFRTVGLYEYKDERFSENALRKDMQLDRRPCYTWKWHMDWRGQPIEDDYYQFYQVEMKRRAGLPKHWGGPLEEQWNLKRQSSECRFPFPPPPPPPTPQRQVNPSGHGSRNRVPAQRGR